MSTTIINNPLIWADIPDVDMIRHGDHYYMVSTTMHMTPGCPIMKSSDLKHWEIVNYVYETYGLEPKHQLLGGQHIYGQGSWAACIREHNGKFYVCFSCNDVQKFFVYTTDDIERGTWQCSVIDKLFHDPTLIFYEDRAFVIYGNGDIYIQELTSDASQLKEDGINQLLLQTESEGIGLRAEGCHAYFVDGYFYLFFIEWPTVSNKRRRQVCYRSKQLLGPYEGKVILDDHLGHRNNGVAQGGIVQSKHGEWFSLLFQDREAVGRIPVLVPMSWEDDWPKLGIDGKVPKTFEILGEEQGQTTIVVSDEFDYKHNQLAMQWQWNHNPDHQRWSVIEEPGCLRLKTGQLSYCVLQARNTLTQRTIGPSCEAIVQLNIAKMQVGDHAGIVALQSHFGTVGVIVDQRNEAYVTMTINDGQGLEKVIENIRYTLQSIELKIRFDFMDSIDEAHFYYREPGAEQWIKIGSTLQMKYTLDHFMGYRIGLYCYATEQVGGYADFDYFHYYVHSGNKRYFIPYHQS